jgi:hypothetical protein
LDLDLALGSVQLEKKGLMMSDFKESVARVMDCYNDLTPPLGSLKFVTLCTNCIYLRKCRACYKCNNPKGLPEPDPDIGTFCYYGATIEESEVDDNECKTTN